MEILELLNESDTFSYIRKEVSKHKDYPTSMIYQKCVFVCAIEPINIKYDILFGSDIELVRTKIANQVIDKLKELDVHFMLSKMEFGLTGFQCEYLRKINK